MSEEPAPRLSRRSRRVYVGGVSAGGGALHGKPRPLGRGGGQVFLRLRLGVGEVWVFCRGDLF